MSAPADNASIDHDAVARLIDGAALGADVRPCEGEVLIVVTAGSVRAIASELAASAPGAAWLADVVYLYDQVLVVGTSVPSWAARLAKLFEARRPAVVDCLMVGAAATPVERLPGAVLRRIVRLNEAAELESLPFGIWNDVIDVADGAIGSEGRATEVTLSIWFGSASLQTLRGDNGHQGASGDDHLADDLWLSSPPRLSGGTEQEPPEEDDWLDGGHSTDPPVRELNSPTEVHRTLRQHMAASAPEALAPGRDGVLDIVVSGSRVEMDGGSSASAPAVLGQPLVVSVFARGSLELIGSSRHELPVQAVGSSKRLQLAIRATSDGLGRLNVLLEQGADTLITLDIPVLTRLASSGGPRTASGAAEVRQTRRDRNRLTVLRDGEWLRYVLSMPSIGHHEFAHRLHADAATLLAPTFRQLEELYQVRSDHSAALDRTLEGIGAEVTSLFAPPDLLRLLWAEVDDFHQLEIVSDEPAIPWELMRLESPLGDLPADRRFLGERGVTRTLFGSQTRVSLPMRSGRRFSVVAVAQERDSRVRSALEQLDQELATRYRTRSRQARLSELVTLLASDDFDLLHFGGHAQGGFTASDAAVLLLDDTRLINGRYEAGGFLANTVAGFRFANCSPTVFLNACQSGRLATNLGGFAARFMRAGAAAFVGTQWAVAAEPAANFARTFYAELLDGGRTLAESVSTARQERGGLWSASRLAYVAYGDPDATVTSVD